MNYEKKDCPIIGVDGFIEKGKQFDIEINLPEDRRNVVSGVIKDFFQEPIEDAVVVLIEVENHEREPVSHTFTNRHGEFIFGPLCPDKKYEILFWANQVKNVKVCAKGSHEMNCLKGTCMDKCDFDMECDEEKHENECTCDKD